MMWAFSLSAENLNTSFSEPHVSPLLWVWCPEPRPTTLQTLGCGFSLFHSEHSTVGPECVGSSHPRVGVKESLTEFSFSCSPSPLGSEDRLLAEFLFGVEVMAPAFFFTVSTSQLAWSSLCVLFPALMTLEEKPEKPIRLTPYVIA